MSHSDLFRKGDGDSPRPSESDPCEIEDPEGLAERYPRKVRRGVGYANIDPRWLLRSMEDWPANVPPPRRMVLLYDGCNDGELCNLVVSWEDEGIPLEVRLLTLADLDHIPHDWLPMGVGRDEAYEYDGALDAWVPTEALVGATREMHPEARLVTVDLPKGHAGKGKGGRP